MKEKKCFNCWTKLECLTHVCMSSWCWWLSSGFRLCVLLLQASEPVCIVRGQRGSGWVGVLCHYLSHSLTNLQLLLFSVASLSKAELNHTALRLLPHSPLLSTLWRTCTHKMHTHTQRVFMTERSGKGKAAWP